MKKQKQYKGWLSECPFGFLAIDENQNEYRPDSLAEAMQDDWEEGEKVFVRIYISENILDSEEQAVEALMFKVMGGGIEPKYELDAYSEYTIMDWEQNLVIGGHDMIKELNSFLGKYALIIVEKVD